MNELPCDRLDEYLAGDLSDEEQAHFSDHLLNCRNCRNEVIAWESGRQLLKRAIEQLELPSATLVKRLERTTPVTARPGVIDSGRRVVVVAACTLLAAGLCLWYVGKSNVRLPKTDIVLQTNHEPANVPSKISLTFPEDVISVPVDIGDPNVTIVWLYPAASFENETK